LLGEQPYTKAGRQRKREQLTGVLRRVVLAKAIVFEHVQQRGFSGIVKSEEENLSVLGGQACGKRGGESCSRRTAQQPDAAQAMPGCAAGNEAWHGHAGRSTVTEVVKHSPEIVHEPHDARG